MKQGKVKTVGLFEAKQKLSELVERARQGEEIGITKHGKLVAKLAAAEPPAKPDWDEIFAGLARLRKMINLPKEVDIKSLIEEGRE